MPLRIFISSPGDVIPERRRAQLVIDKLAKSYARFFAIEPILWEVEPMLASGHFQDQIVPPGETDIVVLIVWSRLGTPLPEKTETRAYRGIDGRVPVTGTEWEFEDALAAQKKRGAPDLLAYRKQADPVVSLKDKTAKAAAEEQWEKLDAFWSRWFVDRGQFRAAFSDFTDLDGFEAKLESDLRKLIEGRIGALRTVGEGEPAAVWHTGSPFRGLDSYRFEHAPIFFGRSAMTQTAVEQLTANAESGRAFLLILGASGAGKSSLVQAGAVPALVGRGIVPGVGLWRRAVMRPGGHAAGPFAALSEALVGEDALPELLAGKHDVAALARHLRASVDDPSFSIVAALDRIEKAARSRGELLAIETARLAVVVDQLEELFTGAEMTAEERTAFVRCVDGLARSGRIYVVATIRSDYWHRAAETPLLVEMAAGSGKLDLLPVTQDEIIEMIRQPAEAAGLAFDTDPVREIRLDATLATEAANEPGALPLLSFLLDAIYKNDIHDGHSTLTYASMNALGGLKGAIATRAEAVFATLSADVQAALPRALRSLITVSSAGAEPTARSAALAQFAEGSAERQLIDALLDPQMRLLVADRDATGARVRLAHEALITHWKRAHDQIAQDRDDLRTRAAIEEALAEYGVAPAGRQRKYLLRDPLLANAIDLAARWRGDVDPETLKFIQASRRRARLLQQLIAAAAAVFAGVAIFAGWQYVNARWLEQVAVAERDRANEKSSEAEQKRAETEKNLAAAQLTQSRFLADLAGQNTRAGNGGAAIALALEALPDTRGGNARPYSPEAEAALYGGWQGLQETRLLAGHDDAVLGAAFSPDGRLVVTASWDRTARVWEAESGTLIAVLRGHEDGVTSAAFSPDGRRIITTSGDRTARIWNVGTGKPIAILRGHEEVVRSATFSPDGRLIVTSSDDRTARIWNAETGEPMMVLKGHEDKIYTAAFSPNGRLIVTSSLDDTARIWDVETGDLIKIFKVPEPQKEPTTSAAFSPDGQRIVTTSLVNRVRIWDVMTGQEVMTLSGHTGLVNRAAFSPDGHRIVTASQDKTVRIWDAGTGKTLSVLRGHQGAVQSAAFSADGRRIVTASLDKTARIWDVETRKAAVLSLRERTTAFSAAFSPDGRRIVTALSDRSARIWDAEAGTAIVALEAHEGTVWSAAFSPDGRRVVTASSDKTARVWDAETGKVIAVLAGHGGQVMRAAFSPDGRRVVTASWDNTARIWDAETGTTIAVLKGHDEQVWSAEFSADGRRIVTASNDRTARIWNAETGQVLVVLKGAERSVLSAAFSPDGRWVAATSEDRTVRLWDAATGELRSVLLGHADVVTSVSFSPDGRRIVTASWDNTARVWDIEAGKTIASFPGDSDKVNSAAFGPDGHRIVTVSYMTAAIWRVFASTQELIDTMEHVAPRCLSRGERIRVFLDPEPPAWCIEMEKWPYQSQDWKDWLKFKRTNANPPLPDSAEWKDWIAAHR